MFPDVKKNFLDKIVTKQFLFPYNHFTIILFLAALFFIFSWHKTFFCSKTKILLQNTIALHQQLQSMWHGARR